MDIIKILIIMRIISGIRFKLITIRIIIDNLLKKKINID